MIKNHSQKTLLTICLTAKLRTALVIAARSAEELRQDVPFGANYLNN
ncbi:MAG: hypothetical protein LBT69_03505 [Lactobacillales bacterium]|jgi:hypothetical protein|nr:hypothetical protein [Lactobacillales bacterium]